MLQFATYYRHIHRLPQRGELKILFINYWHHWLWKYIRKNLQVWTTRGILRNENITQKTNLHVLEANIDIIIIQYHVVVFFFYFNRTPLYEREERISMQQILCFILVYYVISLLVDHDAQNRFSLLCQIFCHFKCSL